MSATTCCVQATTGENPAAAAPSPEDIVDGIRNSTVAAAPSSPASSASAQTMSATTEVPVIASSSSPVPTQLQPSSSASATSESGAQVVTGDTEHITTYERTGAVIANSKISLDCKLAVFTVMGTCEPRVVKLFPSTSCSCPAKGGCYHVKAAQLAVGIDEKPNRRQLNLTQLQKNKRKWPDRTCGRKCPRAEDVEIVPAGDADDKEVAELATVVQGSAATADVEPETDDACKECGEPEPPQSSKCQKTVQWVQCDKCNSWFHVCCTHLKKCPRKNHTISLELLS